MPVGLAPRETRSACTTLAPKKTALGRGVPRVRLSTPASRWKATSLYGIYIIEEHTAYSPALEHLGKTELAFFEPQ